MKDDSNFLFSIWLDAQQCQLLCLAHQHIHTLCNHLRNLLALSITLHRRHRAAMDNAVKLRQAHAICHLYRTHAVKIFVPFLIRTVQGIGLQYRDIELGQIIQRAGADAEQ